MGLQSLVSTRPPLRSTGPTLPFSPDDYGPMPMPTRPGDGPAGIPASPGGAGGTAPGGWREFRRRYGGR